MRLRSLGLSLFFTLGCSSSSFAVADPDAGVPDDASDASATDGAVDARPIVDSIAPDSGSVEATPPPDAPPSCVAPSGSTADIYVDRSSLAPSENGSLGCPFKTISAAMVFVGSPTFRRTIHVAGGTSASPLVYTESTNLWVHGNVTLLGAGLTTTRINANVGACISANCTVYVEHGGVVDGFTVSVGGGRQGMATQSGWPLSGASAATIRNCYVTGATGDGNFGILLMGSADLGPGLLVGGNARNGVHSWGSGEVHVIAGGAPNAFDNNGGTGLQFDGDAHLTFEGGTASANTGNGIRFYGPPPGGGAAHVINNLVARNNGGTGVLVSATGHSLVLRGSTLLHNRYGIVYFQGSGGVLDLGRTTGVGDNQFGSATTSVRNTNAGICIEGSRADSVPAHGNRWSSCSPGFAQQAVSACDGGPAYADVWFHQGSGPSGPPLSAASCMVGP